MQVDRHVDGRLHAEHDREPGRGEAREQILRRVGARQGAHDDEGEQRQQRKAHDDAEFLGADREHEIGVTVGEAPLGDALAGAKAEPAAVGESIHGGIDLECIAGSRIHESLDADGDVRDQHIGGEQSGDRGACETEHPDDAHAGDEEQRSPHHQDQHGLAEIRLQHQQRDESQ